MRSIVGKTTLLAVVCFLILMNVQQITANSEQFANPDHISVINAEDDNEDHVYFVPLDKKYHYHSEEFNPGTQMVRRNDFFYAKNLKTLPRIGRRNDFFMKAAGAKSIPRIGRRQDYVEGEHRELTSSWPWYRSDNMIPRVVKKSAAN